MNKNITDISYSWNNLPKHILLAQDNQNTIDYLYNAAGTKLRKVTSSDRAAGLTTVYSGPFVYEDSKLAFIQTSEGRVVPDQDAYAYEYFLRVEAKRKSRNLGNHLGNTRVVFNEQGDVLQDNSYYPFGGIMEGLNYTAGLVPENKYLYNGKEFQDDFGLDWYDYGARFYDAQLGRWHTIDILAEKYFSSTPYSYVESNPIIFIDPNGEDKVIAIVYNQRRTTDKSLWAVELTYDIDKGQGNYKGKIKGGNYSGNFQGKFNSENKSNYLNANLFTKEGAVGLYHQYQDGQQDFGLADANAKHFSFDKRWKEEGTKVPTSLATGIADAFDILNEVSVGDLPLGEAGADAVNERFKEFDGTVEYIKGEDGNISFRFTGNGTDISFKIDYIITEDKKKDDED